MNVEPKKPIIEDLRFIIGLFFGLVGVFLMLIGLFHNETGTGIEPMNFWSGLGMSLFSFFMLFGTYLSRRTR